MTVFYEWDIESYDEPDGDIMDHQHADHLSDLPLPSTHLEKLVLVRNADEGRLWAYAENGMLPSHFSRPEADGKYYETNVKVPKRFHREIAREWCK